MNDKSNTLCCLPTHDFYIKDLVPNLWPEQCSKDVFPGLEKYLCLPCHPDQPKFTDVKKKIVRVCESLLREVYGSDDL